MTDKSQLKWADMAENWRILDFTEFEGKLSFSKTKRRLLSVKSDTGVVTEHSLIDVNIIFVGVGVELGKSLLYHLATNDVVVLFCDWKGIPVSSMYPWVNAHGRVAARQRAQAALSLPRSKNAWMRIVKAKVRGQANNLMELGDYERSATLARLASSVKTGDTSNVEATAAKKYWRGLFCDAGFARKPQSTQDLRNCMLDYGYTILRGHIIRGVLAAGLTPALGLYHRDRGNLFALADDLIEPFRPVVDYEVARIGNAQSLTSEIKRRLLQCTVSAFGADGTTLPTVITEFAQHYGRYVECREKYLDVPVWRPLNNENRDDG